MKNPAPVNTASLLKSWRAELGISQSAAAARLGVNFRTYQGWEAGKPFRFPEILRRALMACGGEFAADDPKTRRTHRGAE